MAVSFIDCQTEQVPALRAFFTRVYGPDYILAVNQSLFDWQFASRPPYSVPGYTVKLAVVEGEVAACLGYLPVDITTCGRIVRGAWTVNWLVDPQQRRLGLGPLLLREVTAQFDITLNIGLNDSAHDLLCRMRWTDLGELTRHVAVLDVERTAALTKLGRLDWPLGRSRRPAPATGVTAIERFGDDVTDFWDRAAGATTATRRCAEFLNWRYADHPVFRYRMLEMRSEGAFVGFAVYRIERGRDLPVPIGRIVDLVASGPHTADLVGAVVADAEQQDVAMLDFFCSSPRLSTALAAHGFLDDSQAPVAQIPRLFQPLDHRQSGVAFMAYADRTALSQSDWYVTTGDADQDRPN
jgi:hypothetical protein